MYRHIKINKLVSNCMMLIFYFSYFIYFVFSLVKVNSKTLDNIYGILFTFYTCLYGLNIIRRSYNVFFIIKNFNQTITLDRYNRNTRDYLSSICNVALFVLECIILSHFYPGFSKCKTYEFNTEICNSLRIIVYSFEVTLTVTILVLLLVAAIMVFSVCNSNIDIRNILKLFDFIDFPKQILRKFKFLKFTPLDKICTICLEEQTSDTGWNILSCGHKYHSECVESWKAYSKNCPICNKEITILNENLIIYNESTAAF
jgi:hypothetical protein